MPPPLTPRQVALAFVERFCAADVDGLAPLLAAKLRFRGPLHQFDSRAAYLASLRADPPQPAGYRLLHLTESEHGVALIYEYQKDEGAITIAQLCKFAGGEISEMLLVFDPAALS